MLTCMLTMVICVVPDVKEAIKAKEQEDEEEKKKEMRRLLDEEIERLKQNGEEPLEDAGVNNKDKAQGEEPPKGE